jgi:hypothetical protein
MHALSDCHGGKRVYQNLVTDASLESYIFHMVLLRVRVIVKCLLCINEINKAFMRV